MLSQALFRAAMLFLFCTVAFGHSFATGEEVAVRIIGNKEFVHLEEVGGIWTMVNGDGESFIPLGMNHVGPLHRFASYNREHWIENLNRRRDHEGKKSRF